MSRSFLPVARFGHPIMTMNKALLALALGFAMGACSNQQSDASAAESTYAAGEAQQSVGNAATTGANNPAAAQAVAAKAAVSAATAAGTSVGDNAAEQARDLAKETAASAIAKTSNAPQMDSTQTVSAVDGKALYQATCVACHGPKGKGAIPGVPDLSKGGILAKPDAELTANILNGFQTKGSPMAMPPKGGNPSLTAADVKALLVYMRAFVGTSK